MLLALERGLGNFSDGIQDLITMQTQPDRLKLLPFYAYPIFIWGFLEGAKTLAIDDPAFSTRGADTVQSLMGMIMYFGQPSVYAQALKSAGVTTSNTSNGTDALSSFAADMETLAPPDVPIYLANLRYQVVVGQDTLTAYMAISGFTLLVCLCIIVYSMLTPAAAKVPRTTAFPAWNKEVNCVVKNERGESQSGSNAEGVVRSLTEREMIESARKMTVKLVEGPP
jgi:hypothetical protein